MYTCRPVCASVQVAGVRMVLPSHPSPALPFMLVLSDTAHSSHLSRPWIVPSFLQGWDPVSFKISSKQGTHSTAQKDSFNTPWTWRHQKFASWTVASPLLTLTKYGFYLHGLKFSVFGLILWDLGVCIAAWVWLMGFSGMFGETYLSTMPPSWSAPCRKGIWEKWCSECRSISEDVHCFLVRISHDVRNIHLLSELNILSLKI